MMPITCCKGCVAPKRHTACWGHCPEYQKQKAEYEELKAAADKKKFIDQGISCQRSAAVAKAMRNRKNKLKNIRRNISDG